MEVFQFVGQELPVMHRLINFVRELRIPGSASFNGRGEIPSAPVALLINFDTRKYPLDVGIPNRSGVN